MKLFLLGRSELIGDSGQEIALPTKRVTLLLSILAMNQGQRLSREVLSETIWPKSERSKRLVSLRGALAHLRRAMAGSAIESDAETVGLAKNSIWTDAANMVGCEEYTGDFMPGFDDDWVVDERLRLRSLAVSDALAKLESQLGDGDQEAAIRFARLACRIDPICQEAAERHIALLNQLGRRGEAVQLADSFQTRSLRTLGVVAEFEAEKTPAPPSSHPLVGAAEWLLDRNPAEATELLAATWSSWYSFDASTALRLHESALQRTSAPSTVRNLVNAQRLYLLWVLGRFDEVISETTDVFESALSEGNFEIANISGSALAYGLLSTGGFSKSLSYVKRLHAMASVQKDRRSMLRAEINLAIIEQHVGHEDAAEARALSSTRLAEEIGSPAEMADHKLFLSGFYTRTGRADEAISMVEQSRRFFEANQTRRALGFSMYGKAELLATIGGHHEALSLLESVRAFGFNVIGHSLASNIDDLQAHLFSTIHEYDVAAESLARSTILRRHLGSKPSVFESTQMTPTRRILKERLDERDIRAAFGRARLSVQQSLA